MTIGSYECDMNSLAIDLRLFSVCLITGYPNVCAEATPALNPFRGLDYEYVSEVVFDSGECLSLTASIVRDARCLRSTFSVLGDVPLRALGSPRPLTEGWTLQAHGSVLGSFSFAWDGPDGVCTRAVACSTYSLDRLLVPATHVREMESGRKPLALGCA